MKPPTGPWSGRRTPAATQRGFTLVEVMVVLVVAAILAGFAVMAVRGRDAQSVVDEEARRLDVLARLAREESVFRYRTLGIRFYRHGYSFLEYSPGEEAWAPVRDAVMKARVLGEGLAFRLYLEGRPVVLEVKEDEQSAPQVVLFPDGTGTDFEAALETPGTESPVLRGTGAGSIRLETGYERG